MGKDSVGSRGDEPNSWLYEFKDLDKANRILGSHVFPVEGLVVAYNPRADCFLRHGIIYKRMTQALHSWSAEGAK